MVSKKKFKDANGNTIDNNIKYKNLLEFENSPFMLEENDDGDESGVVTPWMSAIKPPTTFSKIPDAQELRPNVNFSLEYCYGYRVKYHPY